jgi:thiosulfate dehydrogenase
LRLIINDSQQGLHAWGDVLSSQDIEDLTAFIKQGIIDTERYIARPTRKVSIYDVANGQGLYATRPQGSLMGLCILCHGDNGMTIPPGGSGTPIDLASLANTNPWEVLHKTRFGQPGVSGMPELYIDYSINDAVDVLGYIQTITAP